MDKLPLASLIMASIFAVGSVMAAEPDYPSTEEEIESALSTKDSGVEVNGVQDTMHDRDLDDLNDRAFDKIIDTNPLPKKARARIKIADTDRLPKARARINFQLNSASILPDSYDLLNRYAAALQSYKLSGAEILVCGHTDNLGSPNYNKILSKARAESVRQYLIGRGVQRYRLTTAACGPKNPITDNSTEEGRAMNRRVEFVRVDLP